MFGALVGDSAQWIQKTCWGCVWLIIGFWHPAMDNRVKTIRFSSIPGKPYAQGSILTDTLFLRAEENSWTDDLTSQRLAKWTVRQGTCQGSFLHGVCYLWTLLHEDKLLGYILLEPRLLLHQAMCLTSEFMEGDAQPNRILLELRQESNFVFQPMRSQLQRCSRRKRLPTWRPLAPGLLFAFAI